MSGTTNINELLDLLNIPEKMLRHNSSIEDYIKQNSGTILYSYNNIIIASEISDETYFSLQKNDNIDFIQDLPLKKYGDIDTTLIEQYDLSKISINNNISGNTTQNLVGVIPTIYNDFFTLSALTNTTFEYVMKASGTLPITYEFITPSNYDGNLSLINGNIIRGTCPDVGIFSITFKAYNSYGTDTKKLILTIKEDVKIVNTNLNVYSKLGTYFSYVIETIGPYPKIYSVTPSLPTGVYLDNNIISGTFLSGGTYTVSMGVSGITSSDSKILTINVGVAPIITSSGEIVAKENSDFEYIITSTLTEDVNYNIIGILPFDLYFDGIDTIKGTGLVPGSYTVTIRAFNKYGENLKKLKIIIYNLVFSDSIETTTTTTAAPTTTLLLTTTTI